MLLRAGAIWLSLLVLAILNGIVRDTLGLPRALSSLLLAAGILIGAWLAVPWIGPGTMREAWLVGVVWLVATLVFEFFAGHYLFGTPWAELLEEYDVAAGRLWLLALLATFGGPALAYRMRAR